jgi:hypothetical protein
MTVQNQIKDFFQEISSIYKQSSLIPKLIDINLLVYDLIDKYVEVIEIDTLKNKELTAKSISTTNEIIKTHIEEIENMNENMEKLLPIINDKHYQIELQRNRFAKHKEEFFQIHTKIEELITENTKLDEDIKSFETESKDILNNIDRSYDSLNDRYKFVLMKARNLLKYYPISNYLQINQLKTLPEAEIMQLLIKKPLTLNEIKASIKQNQPVVVEKTLEYLIHRQLVEQMDDKYNIPHNIIKEIKSIAI